jgi:hypothetical protein
VYGLGLQTPRPTNKILVNSKGKHHIDQNSHQDQGQPQHLNDGEKLERDTPRITY